MQDFSFLFFLEFPKSLRETFILVSSESKNKSLKTGPSAHICMGVCKIIFG